MKLLSFSHSGVDKIGVLMAEGILDIGAARASDTVAQDLAKISGLVFRQFRGFAFICQQSSGQTLHPLRNRRARLRGQAIVELARQVCFKLSAWLKTESLKSRKLKRSVKQMHQDLRKLGYEGSYDRVAAFARQWKVDQLERVNSASKSTLG